MRTLIQPGPVHPRRIDSFRGHARRLTIAAPAGATLLAGLTAPLVEAGFGAAVLRFAGAEVMPFRYVMPGPSPDGRHVAYFSAPRGANGRTRIVSAAATFGWNDSAPFLHTHAAWIESDGARRGGHILNDETILAAPVEAEAWGFGSLRIAMSHDEETNFSLFQPSGVSDPDGNAVLARVRPNQDIIAAIEAIAHAHGMADATIAGSVGSLVGTRFDDGRTVPDDATEVLVVSGTVRGGVATLDLVSIDTNGCSHEGRIARGANPVCITFDLVLLREAT